MFEQMMPMRAVNALYFKLDNKVNSTSRLPTPQTELASTVGDGKELLVAGGVASMGLRRVQPKQALKVILY